MGWQTLSYTYLYWRTLHNTLPPHAFRWIVWYSILQNFYLCKFIQPYNVRHTAAIIMQIDCTYHVSCGTSEETHNKTRFPECKIDLTDTNNEILTDVKRRINVSVSDEATKDFTSLNEQGVISKSVATRPRRSTVWGLEEFCHIIRISFVISYILVSFIFLVYSYLKIVWTTAKHLGAILHRICITQRCIFWCDDWKAYVYVKCFMTNSSEKEEILK
jgi:hypothetical protein